MMERIEQNVVFFQAEVFGGGFGLVHFFNPFFFPRRRFFPFFSISPFFFPSSLEERKIGTVCTTRSINVRMEILTGVWLKGIIVPTDS